MTSLGGPLCRLAILACRKWQKVVFQSIDNSSLYWFCCWARCWMLQDSDNMKPSCDFYVKVGTFTHLENSKISLLTVNEIVNVRLTIQYNSIASVRFQLFAGDYLRQTSADVTSLEYCPIDIWQSCDLGCPTPQFPHVNKQVRMDGLVAHCGVVGNPCNVQPYTDGFIMGIRNMLAATYSILTWS